MVHIKAGVPTQGDIPCPRLTLQSTETAVLTEPPMITLMNHSRRPWLSLPCLLSLLSLSRDCQVLGFVEDPCGASGITFALRDAMMTSYDKVFLQNLYDWLLETEMLTNGALAQLENNMKNAMYIEFLQERPQVEALYADTVNARDTDVALENTYRTLDRMMVFIQHAERELEVRMSYTTLREPVLRSLDALKQGGSHGGIYYLMCRILLRLPRAPDTRDIGTNLVPFYLHGHTRAQIFGNTYRTLHNILRVLIDLRGGLHELLGRL